MFWFYILIFIVCCVLMYFAGEWVIESLIRIARFFGWKEFVVAFFVLAFAASLPNLFIGVFSAVQGIPQLSFGDISGNNLVAMTLAVALVALFAKGGLPAESRTVQTTSVFTAAAALLPLVLILDGVLSRGDGILLIAFFIFYIYWLFSKRERFTKTCYVTYLNNISLLKKFKIFFQDMGKAALGIFLLILASGGIVKTAFFFAENFHLPLTSIGLLLTGLGTALPEIYFGIVSARRGETWMILGDLMGSVIFPASLVLGIVALIHPIVIPDIISLAVARFFLLISAIFFLLSVRTDRKISKREAAFLLSIYILFCIVEILVK